MLRLQRVVDILCSPKNRGGLNPSLVEGLIPHLEAIDSTHTRDFSPEGILSLGYPYLIAILFNFFVAFSASSSFFFRTPICSLAAVS